jgi:hypothetical protein
VKFSQFIAVFVAALYNETELTGQSNFRISDILEKYGLTINASWRNTIFDDYTFTSHVDVSRHIGPVEQQRISLSPAGLRWVEDELGENVAEFLERNGATYTEAGPFDAAAFDEATFDTNSGVDSTAWTGLPREGILTLQAAEKLKVALSTVDDAIEKATCSNEERAQARAYVLAIHALADAPEPPADLIWQLIERASSMAGIAALFVALLALFK